MSESPRVTEQKALTAVSGRVWLLVAGIIALLSIGFLWPMSALTGECLAEVAASCLPQARNPVPLAGIGLIVVLYTAMVVVRFTVARLRLRLALLASLTAAIPVVFITCAVLVILAQRTPVPLPLG